MTAFHKLSADVKIKTEGQRLLRYVQASDSHIAAKVGVSRVVCNGWRTGKGKPGLEKRRVLLDVYDIPIAAWDESPISVEPVLRNGRGETLPPKRPMHKRPFNPRTYVPPPEPYEEEPEEEEESDEDISALTQYGMKRHEPLPGTREGIEQLLHSLRHARKKPDLLSSERVKLAQAETRAYALLQKMDKENELSEDRIIRQHPKWAKMRDAILEALKPFPDAAKAVIKALVALEEVS